MGDHEFTCPDCGQLYICDEDDQDPPCCNREALRTENERLRLGLLDATADLNNIAIGLESEGCDAEWAIGYARRAAERADADLSVKGTGGSDE